jgi:hypothetical protein
MARNGRRTDEDYAGQNDAFLFFIGDTENLIQEAFVSAYCIPRADVLKVESWVMGLARTVTRAGRKPVAAGSMAAFTYRTSRVQVSTRKITHYEN